MPTVNGISGDTILFFCGNPESPMSAGAVFFQRDVHEVGFTALRLPPHKEIMLALFPRPQGQRSCDAPLTAQTKRKKPGGNLGGKKNRNIRASSKIDKPTQINTHEGCARFREVLSLTLGRYNSIHRIENYIPATAVNIAEELEFEARVCTPSTLDLASAYLARIFFLPLFVVVNAVARRDKKFVVLGC